MKNKSYLLRRTTTFVLSTLLSFSLLTGCGKKDDADDVTTNQQNTTNTVSNENTGSSEDPSDTSSEDNSTTEATTEEPTTEEPTGLKLSDSAKLISTDSLLYDITDMVPTKEGMDIMDIAAEGNGSYLILYQNSYGTEGAYYSIDRLNLTTGQVTSVYDKKELVFSDESVIYGTAKFASLDPVVIYEAIERKFYLPASNYEYTDSIPTELAPQNIFSNNGIIYSCTYNGEICKYDTSSSSLRIDTIWELPNSLQTATYDRINGNNLILTAFPKFDYNSGKIYLVVDLTTGDLVESYKYEGIADYCFAQTSDANIYLHLNDSSSSIIIKKPDNTSYELSPAGDEEITTMLREGAVNVKSGSFSLSDDGLLFFAGAGVDNFDHILFWDTTCTKPTTYSEGHTPYEVIEVNQETTEAYAKKLSEKFDIDVRLYSSESIEVPDVFDYDITPESDYNNFYRVLTLLDTCYSNYPDGFFTQLYTSAVPLRVILANSMIGTGENTVTTAAGLVNSDEIGDYVYLSTFEGNTSTDTIYHETAHVIYNKLCADGVFFEYQDQWDALNPPDFEYIYSYRADDNPSNEYTGDNIYEDPDIDKVYFVSSYSKTYMTEDIATMMGRLLWNDEPERFFGGEHIQAKFKLLFEIIRKGFDTTGWPEQTYWEKQLQKAYDLAHE